MQDLLSETSVSVVTSALDEHREDIEQGVALD
jgi:hypothetical protein